MNCKNCGQEIANNTLMSGKGYYHNRTNGPLESFRYCRFDDYNKHNNTIADPILVSLAEPEKSS